MSVDLVEARTQTTREPLHRKLIVDVPDGREQEYHDLVAKLDTDQFRTMSTHRCTAMFVCCTELAYKDRDRTEVIRFKLTGSGCPIHIEAQVIPSITLDDFITQLGRLNLP